MASWRVLPDKEMTVCSGFAMTSLRFADTITNVAASSSLQKHPPTQPDKTELSLYLYSQDHFHSIRLQCMSS